EEVEAFSRPGPDPTAAVCLYQEDLGGAAGPWYWPQQLCLIAPHAKMHKVRLIAGDPEGAILADAELRRKRGMVCGRKLDLCPRRAGKTKQATAGNEPECVVLVFHTD